jgi:23S rRNA pseudouridine955/2504/2580 synthase
MLLEIDVGNNDARQRVDRFIRKACPRVSLSRLHYLFRKKEVKIQSRAVSRGHILAPGDKVKIFGLKVFEAQTSFPSEIRGKKRRSLAIPIIYEDDELLAINKPGNMTVHPGSRILPGHSVIEKVTEYLGSKERELFRPSLVHRLDKETSGVLLIAKTGDALRFWTRELRLKRLRKFYQVLVLGAPGQREGTIESKLIRMDSKRGGAKSIVDFQKGQYAKTSYQVLKKYHGFTLLTIRIETGRLHQIRSHLAFSGIPVVGDSRYGDFAANRRVREMFGLKRAFLHAVKLEGTLMNEKPVIFRADLPDELKVLLDRLDRSVPP